MSKELEAFYEVLERSEFAYIGHNDVDIVIKALTPPTAEEVCEALGKHYKLVEFESVLYDKNFGYFVLNRLKEKGIIVFLSKNKIKINDYLAPHLITLIGRFYQSLKGE